MKDVSKKIWKRGDLFIWWAGAGLALSLIMTAALVLGVVVNATRFSGRLKFKSTLSMTEQKLWE